MAMDPLITFKAGRCNQSGRKIVPAAEPGYIFLYNEDDLLHFCWRSRSARPDEAELKLIMFPSDGHFYPLLKEQGVEDLHSPTNGRIYVLKFNSSSQKHYFWMQSKTQHRGGSLSWFSQRDQRLGQIVDALLQGEEVDVAAEVEEMRRSGDDTDPSGDADAMEVDDGGSLERQETGGAGQDATGGDPREEGERSREGGADGGRAPTADTNTLVQNFLNSLSGGNNSSQQQRAETPFTTLSDLLPASTTTTYISSATPTQVDQLCTLLPADLFLLAQEAESTPSAAEPTPAAAQAAIDALSLEQKKGVINRVLRSPQLQQSLGSLTVALRDGGLPMIGDALRLRVENGGLIRGGSMPLGGGDAVEAFVNGVKKTVEEDNKKEGENK